MRKAAVPEHNLVGLRESTHVRKIISSTSMDIVLPFRYVNNHSIKTPLEPKM